MGARLLLADRRSAAHGHHSRNRSIGAGQGIRHPDTTGLRFESKVGVDGNGTLAIRFERLRQSTIIDSGRAGSCPKPLILLVQRLILRLAFIALAAVLTSGCGGGGLPGEQSAAPPDATASSSATETSRATAPIKAEVGVGAKGRDYGSGPVATPVAALFAAKERIAFDIQIPHALELYKAEHDGHGPKTHEEFMKTIIQTNHIQLPALPSGQHYRYDPTKEELMVEKGG